jgi:hypothetical protein
MISRLFISTTFPSTSGGEAVSKNAVNILNGTCKKVKHCGMGYSQATSNEGANENITPTNYKDKYSW